MEIENSVSVKSSAGETLKERVKDYLSSLHGAKEATKDNYATCLESFAQFLENKGIKRFEAEHSYFIGHFLTENGVPEKTW